MKIALFLSLIATTFTQAADKPSPLFASDTITSKTPGHAVNIDIDLKGSRSLFLVVDETGDGFSCDWADWAEPRLTGPKGELKLTEHKWKSASSGWGDVKINASAGGGKLILDGKPVEYGIGTHAPSIIEFEVPEGYTHFKARAGMDHGGVSQADGANASARFFVWNEKPAGNTASDDDTEVPLDRFVVPDDLEITVWAQSPMFRNPTNIDIDHKGRIWVAEGVNYRGQRIEENGDRIVVIEDEDGDGKADKSHVFVQEPALQSPLGVAVFDNVIIVSQPPELLVYTDVDRDLKFDPAKDKREVLLSGFGGRNHDHSLHSVTAGPDGKWYFNQGNTGAEFTDKSGKTFRIGSPYAMQNIAGQKSDDGHVYIGGFSARMNPDGTECEIIGHNYRNSYEHIITSMGDLFQNDNDDPPACRTSWVMEYGNAGFASNDGQRAWGADRRPGQDTPTAEWRQEDPGSMPAGDVYGGGAPTGITFYENGALPEKYNGLLLSCESAKNVVYGYYPKLEGAGFKMERFEFLTSNPDKKWAGADFKGGANKDINTWFRPADVSVGPDGAIYVADWFDPRVGGHGTQDRTLSGTIYRIAPKGFKPQVPAIDLSTEAGQATALKSPAINTRFLGFRALKAAKNEKVEGLLNDTNPYIRARAIWLLAQISNKADKLVADADPQTRITAFRALRRAKHPQIMDTATKLAADSNPAVRREVAFFLRNEPATPQVIDLLVKIAQSHEGSDRAYLEAFGTGAADKEAAVFAKLTEGKTTSDWNDSLADVVWRLKTPAAVPALRERVFLSSLSAEQRMKALESIAFIESPGAADAMVDIANLSPDKAIAEKALFWAKWNHDRIWKAYKPADKLKGGNAKQELVSIVTPVFNKADSKLPSAAEILKLTGDVKRGETAAARCYVCHVIGKTGVDVGPNLTGWGQRFPAETVTNAILDPSAEISLGFEGHHIVTNSGLDIMGTVLAEGDPVIMKSMGGLTQSIPAGEIKSRKKMDQSLMLSAHQLGLSAQDVADIVAYLRVPAE